MTIKDASGQSFNVTGQGQGTYNTIAGSAGLLAFLQNGGLNMLGGRGMAYAEGGCSDNTPVNRYELNLVTALSSKDGEIALLKADKYTDEKIVEATKYLQGEIGKVADKLEKVQSDQAAINLQQATLNATATAQIQCMAAQIAQLQSLSRLVIPSSKVCDTCPNQ